VLHWLVAKNLDKPSALSENILKLLNVHSRLLD
jgi:hypothetical protein